MLEIVRYGEDEYDFPCLLVLGCFDGLHIGHAELLKKAKLQAKINGLDLGVMMFAEGKGGKQLYSFEERMAFLEQYNVKFVLKVNFDEEFKKIKPLEFLECLEDKLNLKAYMSGKDFKFGQGKKGKSSTLKSYADDEENSVWYMSVKEVTYGDEKVSTTKIKELLDAGDVKLAGELLGRNYSISGSVVHGADRGGKEVGYPTLNVDFSEDKYPVKEGVYQVKATLGEAVYDGVANYGARPTFDEKEPVLEVYLEGLDGEHYGEEVKVEFVNYLRDIQKFDGAEALGEQVAKDIRTAEGEEELAVTNTEESETVSHDDGFEAELEENATDDQIENVGEITENEPSEEKTVAEEPVEESNPEEVTETSDEGNTENNSEEVPAEEQPVEESKPEEVTEVPVEEITEDKPEETPTEEQHVEEAPAEESNENSSEEVLAEEQPEEIIEEQPVEESKPEEITEAPVEEITEDKPEEAPAEEPVTEEKPEEVTEDNGENND